MFALLLQLAVADPPTCPEVVQPKKRYDEAAMSFERAVRLLGVRLDMTPPDAAPAH